MNTISSQTYQQCEDACTSNANCLGFSTAKLPGDTTGTGSCILCSAVSYGSSSDNYFYTKTVEVGGFFREMTGILFLFLSSLGFRVGRAGLFL